MRRARVFIGSGQEEGFENGQNVLKPRKIDALLISHRFDDESLYLTIPEIYEMGWKGSIDEVSFNLYRKEFNMMLDEIKNLLSQNAAVYPDIKKIVPVATAQVFEIDQTNRNPFGKILVKVDSL